SSSASHNALDIEHARVPIWIAHDVNEKDEYCIGGPIKRNAAFCVSHCVYPPACSSIGKRPPQVRPMVHSPNDIPLIAANTREKSRPSPSLTMRRCAPLEIPKESVRKSSCVKRDWSIVETSEER